MSQPNANPPSWATRAKPGFTHYHTLSCDPPLPIPVDEAVEVRKKLMEQLHPDRLQKDEDLRGVYRHYGATPSMRSWLCACILADADSHGLVWDVDYHCQLDPLGVTEKLRKNVTSTRGAEMGNAIADGATHIIMLSKRLIDPEDGKSTSILPLAIVVIASVQAKLERDAAEMVAEGEVEEETE